MIPLTMIRSKLTPLIALTALLLLTMAACGGGDGDDAPRASLAAGAIGCEQMREDSYQYSFQVDLDTGPLPTSSPLPTGPGRPPFHFTSSVRGVVQDGVKLQGTVTNTDGTNNTVYEAIQIGDTGYLKFDNGQGWKESDTSVRPIAFPYWPMSVCESLAPDIDTGSLGTPEIEELNGINTERYEVPSLGIDFFKRSPDFGSGSDAASYITGLSGTLWVAETGRYPAKFDFSGQGNYTSGQVFTVQIQFEVWDLRSEVKVSAPTLGIPGN